MTKKIKDINDLLDTIDTETIHEYLKRKTGLEIVPGEPVWSQDKDFQDLLYSWRQISDDIQGFSQNLMLIETITFKLAYCLDDFNSYNQHGWLSPLDNSYTAHDVWINSDDLYQDISSQPKMKNYLKKLTKKVTSEFKPRVMEWRKDVTAFVKKWKKKDPTITKESVCDYIEACR